MASFSPLPKENLLHCDIVGRLFGYLYVLVSLFLCSLCVLLICYRILMYKAVCYACYDSSVIVLLCLC